MRERTHASQSIQMGWPVRMVCAECGHDKSCTIHGGKVPCLNWRTSCGPKDGRFKPVAPTDQQERVQ